MESLILILSILLLISLAAVTYPFRPFVKRRNALLVSLGLFIAIGALPSVKLEQPQTVSSGGQLDAVIEKRTDASILQENQLALLDSTNTDGEIPDACGEGGLALNDVVAVSGEAPIRQEAKATAPKLKNEKASQALGTTHYYQIDNSTTVRRTCAQTEWTKIKIVTPDWLTHVSGWVPNSSLRVIERTSDGTRTFVEADFYWDSDTKKFKSQIISVVNRISRENKSCKKIDAFSVAKSPSRSGPNDPVFFVTCGSGARAFNVFFRPSRAQNTRVFSANG